MSSKTPRARHRRFLSAGFFPPELPPCFYSERMARYRNSLVVSFDKIPPKKGAPDYYSYYSQKSSFGFPRFRKSDRRHSMLNPVAFFFISKVLAENYVKLKKLHKRSKISASPSIFDWSGPRTLKRPSFDSRDSFISSVNARFEFVVSADIGAFYHSIYTHSIPWAIHGKRVAKSNRSDTIVRNLIDRLCRNAQDGQTNGLPVGPDTSRLIAEWIATGIDVEVQKGVTGLDSAAMRFVDDFTLGCATKAEAERAIASIRRAVNQYELDLNSEKTFVTAGVSTPAGGWKTFIRSLVPKAPYDAVAMEAFIFRVEELAKQNTEVNVQKFALQNSRRAVVDCSNWKFVGNYLISVYKANPTVVDIVVELLVLRHKAHGDVSIGTMKSFVASRLALLCDQRRSGEAAWLLFLAIVLEIAIPTKSVEQFYREAEPACAVLIADAHSKNLITGKVDFSTWNKSLTTAELDGEMWLYAYETTVKNLNGSTAGDGFITAHRYFSEFLRRKVDFYRSGQGIGALSDILHRRKLENAASHKIASELDEAPGVEIDDWDEYEEDLDIY